jgi:internalin A
MRFISTLFICLLLCGLISAQENQTPYEIALERIEEAEASGTKVLNLSNMNLAELPPEIGNLSVLEDLSLYGNSLSSLPPEIGNLLSLKELYLDVNQLQSLPPEIGRLRNLTRLFIAHNKLTSLPPEIGNLQNLDTLWLSGNLLQSLPSEISHLSRLHAMILADNQLSSLPLELASMDNLCVLDLRRNQFRHIPSFLLELQLMYKAAPCTFSIADNPLISPPPEVIAQGTPAILTYLRNEAWWHLQKLIVSGGAALGLVIIGILGLRWRKRRGKKKNG